jgi:hypothetical protein
MVAATPARMPTEHAEALNRILAVTRREWGLEQTAHTPSGPTDTHLTQPAQRAHPARGSRRKQLASLAARAFEAQVMALRCRQAFVG